MHSTIAAMYPRMRTGIFFTPTTEGDGVLLTNGSEVVSFLGASTYAWLDRLSPHLDGSHSVADLTASLPPAPRQMVEKLVGALHEAGLVRDVSQDRAHSLTADELELYATEIAFVEAFHTSPALRFQRYRETRVAVIGSGAVFAAAVEGALLTGVARLSARPTPERGSEDRVRERLVELTVEAGRRDPGQRLETAALDPADPVALRDAVEAADLVLYAADRTDPGALRALDGICADLGRTLIPVTLYRDEAWVGPTCAADRPETRWESLWLRLGERPEAERDRPRFLTGPVPGIVANHLIFRAFEHLTGGADASAPDEDGPGRASGTVRLDLETLQTSAHELAPHPLVRRGDRSTDGRRIRELADGAAVDASELAARVVPLTDDRLGILGPVSEAHLEQFPLRVVRLAVTDPHRPGTPFTVWGAGSDFPRSQDAALRHGLAAHAVRSAAATTLTDGVTGVRLVDGANLTVPAAQVFVPAGDAEAGVLPVGTAGAATWAAAVEQGLLDHVLRGAPAGAARKSADRRTTAQLDLTAGSQRFLELLAASGKALTAYAVDAPAGVHLYAFQLGADPAALVEHGAGFTAAEAVEAGLGRLLLAWQADNAGQPEYAPAPAVNLRTSAADTRADALRHAPFVEALHTAGAVAVAVPLDGDPAVQAVLPYLVRVVLLDA
ncbi:hypothetical protein [Streptomyces sp. NBC_01431]|uniref:hypothetical protein n=1 Tax=Streptomyces sp. NBC_01431 TaxID=2903863 RepID=UPI002E34B49B|nr:hypothetical protein [Streptomyces sp. NBC_01431]